jgi:hypothetical protein
MKFLKNNTVLESAEPGDDPAAESINEDQSPELEEMEALSTANAGGLTDYNMEETS